MFGARPKQTPQERQSELKFLALVCGRCWCFTPLAGRILPDGVDMNDRLDRQIGRRDLLLVLTVGAAAASAAPVAVAAPQAANTAKPSKARYQANSPEVQTFYRVNRYPAK